MLTKVVCICLLNNQKHVTCSLLVWFVLFYESLQSKTCSLSFQNLVTFFHSSIHWFIHNLDHGKVFPKWEWGKSEYDLVMLYIKVTPFFKLSSKILFVWSCDLSLMPYMVITRNLAVIWWSLTHLSWNWREKSKDIIYLYLALFGCHKQL